MDRDQLADFLRTRREALTPGDVGLAQGPRRRTKGLRREEVAQLVGMSTDYYVRLEQRRGPQPSDQMIAALARGLRLTLAERDHLYRLCGHTAPSRRHPSSHVSPALMRILDRLDTPAMVVSDLSETLAQNNLAIALFGDQMQFTGLARSLVYRWFTDPAERRVYPEADHPYHSAVFAAGLRARLPKLEGAERLNEIVAVLSRESEEFASLWARHDVLDRTSDRKRIVNPMVGELDVDCQTLLSEADGQTLLVFTATPGTEDADKLQLLGVIGAQQFSAG